MLIYALVYSNGYLNNKFRLSKNAKMFLFFNFLVMEKEDSSPTELAELLPELLPAFTDTSDLIPSPPGKKSEKTDI